MSAGPLPAQLNPLMTETAFRHRAEIWVRLGCWVPALPKGAQLHHVVLLESLWGLVPSAEQLRCSWLWKGAQSKWDECSPGRSSGILPGYGRWDVGTGCHVAHLDDADGFSGEVVAGVGEEGQH